MNMKTATYTYVSAASSNLARSVDDRSGPSGNAGGRAGETVCAQSATLSRNASCLPNSRIMIALPHLTTSLTRTVWEIRQKGGDVGGPKARTASYYDTHTHTHTLTHTHTEREREREREREMSRAPTARTNTKNRYAAAAEAAASE